MSVSLDTANRLLNEQEEQISQLEDKILDLEGLRDEKVAKLIELHKALRRIECADDLETCQKIAREAGKIGV